MAKQIRLLFDYERGSGGRCIRAEQKSTIIGVFVIRGKWFWTLKIVSNNQMFELVSVWTFKGNYWYNGSFTSNVSVALRVLFLAVPPVTVAGFIKFKPIETYLRSTMTEDRLSSSRRKLVTVVV